MSLLLRTLTEPLLLDGGMGTALSARGLDPKQEPSPSWNLRRPSIVREVHAGFASAGSDVILTNTFCANPWQMRASDTEIEACNREGVVLARAERPVGTIIAGNIGPTGLLPPPEGTADLDTLENWFETQARTLVSAGAQWLMIETLYHPKEARAAVRGSRRAVPETPIIASMACRKVAGQFKTVAGLSWLALLKSVEEEGVDAVGVNCSLTPEEMLPLVELLSERTSLPIFAKPTVTPTGGAPLYPGEFAAGLVRLISAGAQAVGGCCGTSAADIAAARAAIDALPVNRKAQATRPFGCATAHH